MTGEGDSAFIGVIIREKKRNVYKERWGEDEKVRGYGGYGMDLRRIWYGFAENMVWT